MHDSRSSLADPTMLSYLLVLPHLCMFCNSIAVSSCGEKQLSVEPVTRKLPETGASYSPFPEAYHAALNNQKPQTLSTLFITTWWLCFAVPFVGR